MAVANVCYHMSIPVANGKTATTNFEPCNNMPNPRIRPLLKAHKSASSIHLCASIRAISSSLYSGSNANPNTWRDSMCYFIDKCSGIVTHHINLSHVYGSATAEACPTSTRRVTKQSGFSLVNHFLTFCCDGCCQMTEYARNSNVQVSFMNLVAISNYRIKDKSLLNI